MRLDGIKAVPEKREREAEKTAEAGEGYKVGEESKEQHKRYRVP